jgi:hypothetical protein
MGLLCYDRSGAHIIKELKKYDIDKGYEGPFYDFSGLILGCPQTAKALSGESPGTRS